MFFSCREPKLKTLTTGPVFVGTKYVELKTLLSTSRISQQESRTLPREFRSNLCMKQVYFYLREENY